MSGKPKEFQILDVQSFRTSLNRSNVIEFPKTFEPELTIIVDDLRDRLSLVAKLMIIIVSAMPDELLVRIKGKRINSAKKILKHYFMEVMELEKSEIEIIWEELQAFIRKVEEISGGNGLSLQNCVMMKSLTEKFNLKCLLEEEKKHEHKNSRIEGTKKDCQAT